MDIRDTKFDRGEVLTAAQLNQIVGAIKRIQSFEPVASVASNPKGFAIKQKGFAKDGVSIRNIVVGNEFYAVIDDVTDPDSINHHWQPVKPIDDSFLPSVWYSWRQVTFKYGFQEFEKRASSVDDFQFGAAGVSTSAGSTVSFTQNVTRPAVELNNNRFVPRGALVRMRRLVSRLSYDNGLADDDDMEAYVFEYNGPTYIVGSVVSHDSGILDVDIDSPPINNAPFFHGAIAAGERVIMRPSVYSFLDDFEYINTLELALAGKQECGLFFPAFAAHNDAALLQSLGCELTLTIKKNTDGSIPPEWQGAPGFVDRGIVFDIEWFLALPMATAPDGTVMRHQATSDGWTMTMDTTSVAPGATNSSIGYTNTSTPHCVGYTNLHTVFIDSITIESPSDTFTFTATYYGSTDGGSVGSIMEQTAGPRVAFDIGLIASNFLPFTSPDSCVDSPSNSSDAIDTFSVGSWLWRYHPFIKAPAVDAEPTCSYSVTGIVSSNDPYSECCVGNKTVSLGLDSYAPDFSEFQTRFTFTLSAAGYPLGYDDPFTIFLGIPYDEIPCGDRAAGWHVIGSSPCSDGAGGVVSRTTEYGRGVISFIPIGISDVTVATVKNGAGMMSTRIGFCEGPATMYRGPVISNVRLGAPSTPKAIDAVPIISDFKITALSNDCRFIGGFQATCSCPSTTSKVKVTMS